MELLGHMVVLFLNFCVTSILFAIVAAPIYIPTNRAQVFVPLSLHPHQHLLFLVFLIIATLTGVKG